MSTEKYPGEEIKTKIQSLYILIIFINLFYATSLFLFTLENIRKPLLF